MESSWTWTGVNWSAIEFAIYWNELNAERDYRPVLPAADKRSAVVCVCKPCICCLISVVGIVATECQTLQCDAPFGRCRLINVSALAVKQPSCESYLYVREHLTKEERMSRSAHWCIECEYNTFILNVQFKCYKTSSMANFFRLEQSKENVWLNIRSTMLFDNIENIHSKNGIRMFILF